MSEDAGAGRKDPRPVAVPDEENPVFSADTQEPDTENDDEGPGTWPTSMPQPGRRDPMVWIAIALIGCLVLLLIFANVPGIRSNAGTALEKAEWQLQSGVDGTGAMVPAVTGPAVTLRFNDGSLAGVAGCNRYAATYTTEDYTINVTNLVRSEMYCMDPGVMAQEDAYLSDLDASTEFRITASELKMFDRTGKPLLVFTARP